MPPTTTCMQSFQDDILFEYMNVRLFQLDYSVQWMMTSMGPWLRRIKWFWGFPQLTARWGTVLQSEHADYIHVKTHSLISTLKCQLCWVSKDQQLIWNMLTAWIQQLNQGVCTDRNVPRSRGTWTDNRPTDKTDITTESSAHPKLTNKHNQINQSILFTPFSSY